MFKTKIAPAVMALALCAAPVTAQSAPAETISKTTHKSVDGAVDAFLAVLAKKGATVFAVVDHAKGAEKVGMTLDPATLVIFGNPKIGTPLMTEALTMGIDLPLKALFTQNESGKTQILYTDIRRVAMRHGIDDDNAAVQKVAKILDALTSLAAN